ncbi:MAG: aminopeptidase P N-terminal domain-containing protein [Nitrospinae bacterium]|nr:aminopeptidase P N-terminal domain-containing protein [Nitrospinota bacterium]
MPGIRKKKYSGIFRDGGAGRTALRRFRERRQKLMARENALMVIAGVPHGPGQETAWSYAYCPTYQEPAIMYLTGINQPGVILLLDPHSRKSDEILFVNKKDPVKEFWDGVHLGAGSSRSLAEARRVTGIREVRDIEEFEKVLKERFDKQPGKKLGTLWIEGVRDGKRALIKTDHNWNFKSRVSRLLAKWKVPSKALFNVMKSHFELRLPLDSCDAANTLRAQRVTGEAFKETLRSFRGFSNECQVQGFIDGQMLMRSSFGLSFPTIVASGANATTLHYVKNDDDFGKDELVLIDFGSRWMTMHADISRTVPASGRFDPMQRMLYEIVLRAQVLVERKARMGVAIKELNELCWSSVNHDLENGFKAAGGKWKLKYKQRPHGVSHLIGEQEHDGDPFRNYANEPMRAGWLISNEPGLYGHFRLRHKGKTYDEEIGIRIEDNLLITKNGCRNLSRGIPKTVSEIETLMLSGRQAK